jgi:hypothetical protein
MLRLCHSTHFISSAEQEGAECVFFRTESLGRRYEACCPAYAGCPNLSLESEMLKRLAALAALGVSAISANAAVVFQFSFNNVAGTLAGTIHGEITLDFLSSGSASGIGSASEVRITSAPAGIPVAVEGSNLASWLTQVQNRFEVLARPAAATKVPAL